jgi:predicted esterase
MDGSGDRAALTARPGDVPSAAPPAAGSHALEVERTRDSLLYVPPRVGPAAAPLLVVLHGAGGHAEGAVALLRGVADLHGLILLAPASRESTWDGVHGAYGPDVDVLDRSLRRAFHLAAVDPERVGVAGFSDGASYALGVGLANGGLFRSVLAFSPGFVPPAGRTGRPRIFVSHGTADEVLPVGRTSRRIVPALEEDGYEVEYAEFEGGHTVPRDVALRAVEWLGWTRPAP